MSVLTPFFLHATAPTEIYTLSLHDALPIWEFRGDSGLGGNIRIWDQHAHLGSVPGDTPEERMAFLVKCMDRVDRKSTRLNSSHANISYAVFCLKKKTKER